MSVDNRQAEQKASNEVVVVSAVGTVAAEGLD